MGGSPSKSPPPDPPDHPDEDRRTVVPDFDPNDFARDSELRLRAPLATEGESTLESARRLHLAGEHEQALFLLTSLLAVVPLHPEATALADACSARLEHQCLAALGSEKAVLVASVANEELKAFAIDHVSAFLLSRMDGATDVETLLDVAGLPRLLALRHLRNLLDRGIVSLASRSTRRSMPEPPPPRSSPRPDVRRERDDDRVAVEKGEEAAATQLTLDAVPALLVAREELPGLDVDPRAAGLLALVDDHRTVEEILTATRTDMVSGVVLFERLAEAGIITFV
jgi:hypothetical protein